MAFGSGNWFGFDMQAAAEDRIPAYVGLLCVRYFSGSLLGDSDLDEVQSTNIQGDLSSLPFGQHVALMALCRAHHLFGKMAQL